MKKKRLYLSLVIMICIILTFVYGKKNNSLSDDLAMPQRTENSSQPAKIYQRVGIEKQAQSAFKAGHYQDAIELYRQAINPMYINVESDKASAIGALSDIFVYLDRYDEALKEFKWFLRHDEPAKQALDEYADIKALKTYKETNDPKGVLERIEYYKKEYPDNFPPRKFHNGSLMSNVLQLYDKTRQYELGAQFARELAVEVHREVEKYGVILMSAADDAKKHSVERGGDKTHKGRAYLYMSEYLAIAEAFEKDKATGSSGGPTQIIIQSENIPW